MSYNLLEYVTYLWGLMLLAFTSNCRSDLFLNKLFRKELRNNDAILKLVSFCPCPLGGLMEGGARTGGGVSTLQIQKQHKSTQRAHAFLLLLIGGINSQ